jgi:hypothetical protein
MLITYFIRGWSNLCLHVDGALGVAVALEVLHCVAHLELTHMAQRRGRRVTTTSPLRPRRMSRAGVYRRSQVLLPLGTYTYTYTMSCHHKMRPVRPRFPNLS